MKPFKKVLSWVGSFVFGLIVIFAVCGIGYVVYNMVELHHVNLEKPINYDKPKVDTVTFDENHSQINKLDTAD